MNDFAIFGAIASIAFSAVGSAMGTGTAGMGAMGAWRKCYLQNKTAPFLLIAFVGAPITQTIYGLILMNNLLAAVSVISDSTLIFSTGVLGGLAIGFSAWFQGKVAASASESFAETGRGFANALIVLGIVETVALFVMVFLLNVITMS